MGGNNQTKTKAEHLSSNPKVVAARAKNSLTYNFFCMSIFRILCEGPPNMAEIKITYIVESKSRGRSR